MRSTAMVAALSLAGASCGVQTDQRAEIAPEAEAAREDGQPLSDMDEALLGTIRCKRSEYGMKCADRCGNAGMFCADLRPHPYKKRRGRRSGVSLRRGRERSCLLVLLRRKRRHVRLPS